MTSYFRRLDSGAVATDRPIRIRQLPRAAEISSFPRKFAGGHRRAIVVLRAPPKHLRRPLWAVRDSGGGWERSKGASREGEKAGPCSYAVDDQMAEDLAAAPAPAEAMSSGEEYRTAEVVVAAAVTVVMGVGNRVLYKLALVPLKHYPFFLAQLATFGYNSLSLSPCFFFFFCNCFYS